MKKRVNEGVSQWWGESLDEGTKKRFLAIDLRHFGFRQEFSKTKEKTWEKNILYFHELLPEIVLGSVTEEHTRKIESNKDV